MGLKDKFAIIWPMILTALLGYAVGIAQSSFSHALDSEEWNRRTGYESYLNGVTKLKSDLHSLMKTTNDYIYESAKTKLNQRQKDLKQKAFIAAFNSVDDDYRGVRLLLDVDNKKTVPAIQKYMNFTFKTTTDLSYHKNPKDLTWFASAFEHNAASVELDQDVFAELDNLQQPSVLADRVKKVFELPMFQIKDKTQVL